MTHVLYCFILGFSSAHHSIQFLDILRVWGPEACIAVSAMKLATARLAKPTVQSHDLHQREHGAPYCAEELFMIPTTAELAIVPVDLHIVSNLLC